MLGDWVMLVKSNLDFGGNATITNLPDPTNAQDVATRAYVLANSGGGAVNKLTVDVDFGAKGDYIRTTVSAAWVLTASYLSFTILPNILDHSAEDVILENLKCTFDNIINATSFDLHIHAPETTWGRYKIQVIGV